MFAERQTNEKFVPQKLCHLAWCFSCANERCGQREENKNPVRKSSEEALKFVFRINEIDLKLELVFANGKSHFYHLLV